MSAAAWGSNDNGQYGAGYMGGGFMHMPCAASAMEKLLGGIDYVRSSYGNLYGVHQGKVGFCGGDAYGQGGTGERKLRQIEPAIIPIDELVTQFVAAGPRWLALGESERLITDGGNAYGELGNGTSGEGQEKEGSAVPVYLEVPDILAIEAGGSTSGLLLNNGTVMTWGEGRFGQLGYGKQFEQRTPKLIPNLTGVKQLSIGGDGSVTGHCLALMENGTVLAWGDNHRGESALMPTTSATRTVLAPTMVPGLENIVAVSAGSGHSLALDAEGRVFAWGNDEEGELGIELPQGFNFTPIPNLVPLSEPAVAISAGMRFSLVLLRSGMVRAFGSNQHGVIGTTAGEWSATPLVVPLSGVATIDAGEYTAACTLAGVAPPPPISLAKVSQPGAIRAEWNTSVNTRWRLGIRQWTPVSAEREEWALIKEAAANARSHVWTGLESGERYEVMVQGNGFGVLIMEAVAS